MEKILFILHLPPPIHGSSVVGQNIKESRLINSTFESSFVNLSTSKTINEIGKNPLIKSYRFIKILLVVLKQLVTFKPKLCYIAITAKGSAFYKDSIIAILVKLFGVKIAYHFHNKGVSSRQHFFIDNLLYRICFNNSNAILLSKYLYSDVEKYFTHDRIFYCPNGLGKVNNESKENFGSKVINPYVEILFLSNLIESKGVYVLLDALKILKDKGLKLQCSYVGGEGDISKSELQQRISNSGLEEMVFFKGKRYGEEKEIVFNDADIFVLPTFKDCFPLVLLEAMQHAVPIISTYEGGIKDIVDDGVSGFLIRQRDPIDLALKLEVLIENPVLRRRMGNAGKNKFKNEFTLEKFESNITGILLNLLK